MQCVHCRGRMHATKRAQKQINVMCKVHRWEMWMPRNDGIDMASEPKDDTMRGHSRNGISCADILAAFTMHIHTTRAQQIRTHISYTQCKQCTMGFECCSATNGLLIFLIIGLSCLCLHLRVPYACGYAAIVLHLEGICEREI